MTLQISERGKTVAVSLPAPLVKKVVDIANANKADGELSEYVANLLREAVATHETHMPLETMDQESEEIRVRLKKLGYL